MSNAESADFGIDRRTVLRGAAGAVTAGAAMAATTGIATAQEFGGWLSETSNYDGTVVDKTGQNEVRVTVGAKGNGGNLAFAPPAIRVDPGTTVVWEWNGKGGLHNVHAIKGASFKSKTVSDKGHTFSHDFKEKGIVKYQCDPHAQLGMKGVVVVGDVEVGGGGDEGGGTVKPDFGGYIDGAKGGTFKDMRGQTEVTVTVGGGSSSLAFLPTGLWIDPGTTITFKWVSSGHNVIPESQPDGAGWQGHEPLENKGFTHTHTFDTTGIYKYFCRPHKQLGMLGAIAVGDDVPTVQVGGDAGGEAGGGFTLPTNTFGTTFLVSGLGITGVAAVLVLASELYGSLGTAEEATTEAGSPAETVEPDEAIVREIGHDEYDPWGTASLIAIYFLIVVGLWIFMYFVEFLNNGPTVIG